MIDLATLLALMSQNMRGKSTSLNMMDNPLALALAGVYDGAASMEQEPEFSSLVQEFATSESPAMQMVWDAIQRGLNPDALSSFIETQLTPDMIAETGYINKDFKNAALGAATDYQKALTEQKARDPWAKLAEAGWRRPYERYTLDDVPVPESLGAEDMARQQRFAEAASGSDDAARRLLAAQKNLVDVQSESEKKLNVKELADFLNGLSDQELRDFNPQLANRRESRSGKKVMGSDIADFGPNNLRERYAKWMNRSNNKVGEAMTGAARASRDVESARRKTLAARLEAQDLRQVAMDRALAEGRTPFRDQAAILMQFFGVK